MSRIFLQLSISILFVVSINAQTSAPIDEFGKISLEEVLSRMDSLGAELSQNPDTIALLRISAGKQDLPGYPFRYSAIMMQHLSNRKIARSRFFDQQCESENGTEVAVFLIRKGDKVLECKKTIEPFSKTVLFDSQLFNFDYPGFDNCCPIIGADQAMYKASLNAFAKALLLDSESRAFVFAYNGTNVHGINNRTIRILDSPSKAQGTASSAKKFLVEKGIDPARIVSIALGYKDSTRSVDFWLVPKDVEIPKPNPNFFLKKRNRKTR